VMEIPDVIVVNKAEHPLTDTMVREVRTALSLGPTGDWKVPIIKTVASEGTGIAELLEAVEAHRAYVEESGTLDERRARNLRSEVLGLAAARMRRELELRIAEDDSVAALLETVVRRETDPASAAAELLRRSKEQDENG
jgi:LAO/AO transport system kinase